MKAIQKSLIAAACASTMLFAGSAYATDLNVSATVTPVCSFKNPSYRMNFGAAIDPSVNAPLSQLTHITYNCTNGTLPATFTVGGNVSGATVTLQNGGNTMPATVTWATPLGTGTGSATASFKTVDVTGTIAAVDRQAAYADTYNGTFPLVIAP